MNLDRLALLQRRLGFLCVGLEWGIGRDVGARGDGRAVADALVYFLALVDL